jgi:hypothetical protein
VGTSLSPSKSKIRQAHRALCALTLLCALVPAGIAQQSSTANSTAADSTAKKPASQSTTTPHHKTTTPTAKSSAHTASTGKRSSHRKSVRARGQQKIDSERAQSIQQALIREHYLTGEPTGTWNQASEDAMRRYQADHGWQTKEVPDSRALIKLGLGPSNDHLLNPESAMTSGPVASRSASSAPTSHSGDPEAHTTANPTPPADPTPATSPGQDAPHPQ